MVIYLDLILLSNFVINLLFLYFIEKLFDDKIIWRRIVFAGIVGSLMVLIYFLDYFFVVMFKIIGGIIIVLIGLSNISKSKQIIKISLFYVLNFALVGFLQAFRINEWYLLIVSLIVILGLVILENNKKYFIFIKNLQYNVIVNLNNEIVKLKGFLDTGNECFYNGIPVVFINECFYNEKFISIGIFTVKTINGINCQNCFKPDCFWIIINNKKIKKDVYVVFTNIGEKECLINPSILL